jgi:hypothetical protein
MSLTILMATFALVGLIVSVSASLEIWRGNA